MNKIKFILVTLFLTLGLSAQSNSNTVPASFADLAEKLMPSVVNISTTQTVVTNTNPFPFQFPPGSPFEDMFKEFGTPQERKSSALGSGFIIDEKGIVITNNHVIQDAEDIIVRVNGDEEFKAKIIGADPLSDIAVLQLETDKKFIPVAFGDSDKARIGDWVIAIGNPFGLGGTVTSGIISARNRDINLTSYSWKVEGAPAPLLRKLFVDLNDLINGDYATFIEKVKEIDDVFEVQLSPMSDFSLFKNKEPYFDINYVCSLGKYIPEN